MADLTLGCGEYRVFLTNRSGALVIADITSALSQLTWGRLLDDTAEADLDLAWSGSDTSDDCCTAIGTARVWIHGLLITRDGELVFFGPLVDVDIKVETAVFKARDATAWFDVRVLHDTHIWVSKDILDGAVEIITDAILPDDPFELISNLTIDRQTPAILVDYSYPFVNTSYCGDVLRELARLGLDYTALGTRIILGNPIEYGPFVTLTDEDFQVDVDLEEAGLQAATKWYVLGSGVDGVAGGIDPYYGLLERIVSEDTIIDVGTANTAAAGRLSASNPAPLFINVPDGARLSPNAPVLINQLVPGTLFRVRLRELCRDVSTVKRLTGIKVVVSNTLDESVQISLSPTGILAGEAQSTITGIAGVEGGVE